MSRPSAESEARAVRASGDPVDATFLLEPSGLPSAPDPCLLLVVGASGDLASRKLVPAVYSLQVRGLLPERFAIVGLARAELSTDEWREQMREAAVRRYGRDPLEEVFWDRLAQGLHYVAIDFAAASDQLDLEELLARLEEEHGTEGNRLYYLAVPPAIVAAVVNYVGKRGRGRGWTRVVVEKPFGRNLASAHALNELLHCHFREEEIFRIDHYLGKETVQNLLVLRFANGIFEPLWNRQLVDHVQITVAETVGIEGRAEYYEQTGAIRDMFQNHLLQLLALTAMEPPIDLSPEQVRNEKVKVLRAMHTPGPKHVVRGQYGRGIVDSVPVPAYRDEPGVASDSMTETYVAAKLYVDDWRWFDTPFYLRTGKRLARRETSISVQFRRTPRAPFKGILSQHVRPNALTVRIQPDEGVTLEMVAKVPGQGLRVRPVQMDFRYGGAFGGDLPEPYERLLLDAMLGDRTLFMGPEEVEEQWQLVDSIVATWPRDRPAFPNYPAGSWGPTAADELLHRDGRSWRTT